MNRSALNALIAAAALATAGAHAAAPGDPAAGQQKSQPCTACHGPDGNSEDPIYPIIAGQYRDYLAQALRDYRAGVRNNAIMRGFATSLSDQDILDLAVFYAQQASPLRTPEPE